MTTAHLARLRLQIDDWRVRQHFKRVEFLLRNRDVSHLPSHLQLSREHYLDMLRDYAARGVFPRNHERAGISPCFIDRDGRECAVAHLIMRSDYPDLAHNIASIANYATVPQIDSPEFDAWGSQAGLTREELTLIQPGYWSTFGDVLPAAISAWSAGLILVLFNGLFILWKRKGIVLSIIGLVTAVIGFVLLIPLVQAGFTFLDAAIEAFQLGIRNDGVPYTRPLHDVIPVLMGFVISFGLAWLTARLSVHRLLAFINYLSRES